MSKCKMGRKPVPLIIRLLSHTKGDLTNPQSHWLWTGLCKSDGYGIIGYTNSNGIKSTTTAHRAMWRAVYHVKLSKNIDVGHRPECGCPRNCVNVNHLKLCTRKENILDSVAVGTHKNNLPHSEHIRTAEERKKICSEVVHRSTNSKELAAEFGISLGHLLNLVFARTRPHKTVYRTNSKLTWAQVKELRKKYKVIPSTLYSTAAKHHIAISTLHQWLHEEAA